MAIDCFNARDAEIEIMEAAYGESFRLIDPPLHDKDAVFDITIDHSIDLKLRFSIPPQFPDIPIRFQLDGNLTHSLKLEIREHMQSLINDCPDTGAMFLCQSAMDYLAELQLKFDRNTSNEISPPKYDHPPRIARFLIYFHHIMSTSKRQHLVEWARDLKLGGYSKPGYPGSVNLIYFVWDGRM